MHDKGLDLMQPMVGLLKHSLKDSLYVWQAWTASGCLPAAGRMSG